MGHRARCCLQVIGGFQYHRIAAGGFRIDLLARTVLLQPAAEAGAAGEIDNGGVRVLNQWQRGRVRTRIGSQRDEVGVVAGFCEHLTANPRHKCDRQRRRGVGFQHHRITRGQRSAQRGVGVPQGKRGAADHHADATRHQAVALVQAGNAIAPELALPVRGGRHILHGLVGVGECLQAAVQGVGTTAGKSHHIGLSGAVHGGVGVFKQLLTTALQDFQAHANPRFRCGRRPGGARRVDGRKEHLGVGPGVAHAERFPRVGRHFLPHPGHLSRLHKRKILPQLGLKARQPSGRLLFAVNLAARVFRPATPGIAVAAGIQRFGQQVLVLGEQGAHRALRSLLQVSPCTVSQFGMFMQATS